MSEEGLAALIRRVAVALYVGGGRFLWKYEKLGPNTNLVIRSRDAGQLAAARADVEAMLARVRAAMKAPV